MTTPFAVENELLGTKAGLSGGGHDTGVLVVVSTRRRQVPPGRRDAPCTTSGPAMSGSGIDRYLIP